MPAPGLVTNYNLQQIFLGENWYTDKYYTNATGSPVTIRPGTILGTILASNKWLPFQSDATDGSEVVRAVANDYQVVADGATVLLNACTKGQVNQNALIFTKAGDTINTAVGGATTGGNTVQDAFNQCGIILDPSVELSVIDPNQ